MNKRGHAEKKINELSQSTTSRLLRKRSFFFFCLRLTMFWSAYICPD
jgi:hypothetical protein